MLIHTIEEMHEIAKKNNGECLSGQYKNNKTPLVWHCFGCNRVWEAPAYKILLGNWCGFCKKRIGLEIAKKNSLKKGFIYLDDHYNTAISSVNFQCVKCGYKFVSCYSNIIKAHKCLNCIKIKWFQKINDIAKKHEGECLTKFDQLPVSFNAQQTVFKWKCKRGHIWKKKLQYVLNRDKWCDRCPETASMGLVKVKQIAKDYGGKCLSTKYKDSKTKLEFQCKHGHKFKLTPNKLRIRWCPFCGGYSKSENIVKCYFEQIFDTKFEKIKPDWLLNKNGNKMELDGYCQKLGLAFEHNGIQHYEIVNKFKMTEKKLKFRKESDSLKVKLCEDNNIKLFVIPALFEITPLEDLYNVIIDQCDKFGIKIDQNKKIDISQAFKPEDERQLNILKKIIKKKNGKALIDNYISTYHMFDCECEFGHIFKTNATNIKSGYWCPTCGGTKKLEINILQEFAQKKGGKLLSKEYLNNREKLKWQCEKGHIWFANWKVIKRGHWCHECDLERRKKFKLTIEDMKKIAQDRNGSCLSKEYLGSSVHLKWMCKFGHIWEATPASVKFGRWCPICGKL